VSRVSVKDSHKMDTKSTRTRLIELVFVVHVVGLLGDAVKRRSLGQLLQLSCAHIRTRRAQSAQHVQHGVVYVPAIRNLDSFALA